MVGGSARVTTPGAGARAAVDLLGGWACGSAVQAWVGRASAGALCLHFYKQNLLGF